MSNSESPYVGPRPFMKGDENIFYGRNAEAQALMSLIVSHPAVLLYSQSGAGKTSLLNTKVRQLLEARNVDVVGSSRVGGSLPPDVNPAEIDNIFIYLALTSLDGEEPTKKVCDGKTTLPDYLKSIPRGMPSDRGLVQRVIFFDQFEELFTTSHERWGDRVGFFEQVGQALEDDSLLRVVFAMREEYTAGLNAHVSHLPERLRTRFHLERLRSEAALEAVTKPLEGTNRKFADGVADHLVRNLLRVPVRSESGFQEITGEFVEPVQLQVVCQNIWNSLKDDVTEINAEFIESCGDVDVALANYYEGCLKQLLEKHNIKESRVRRWFDNELITADGLRGTVYQREKTTGSLPNEIVSMLENLRLVRAEPRGGALWYELTHDRFIGPIRKSNRTWFNKEQGGFGNVLEILAAEYKKDSRSENLLRERELRNALVWLKTAEIEGAEVSASVRAFIDDSNKASSKRRAIVRRNQIAALILLSLGALALAGWAYREKRNADRARYVERAEVANDMLEQKRYHDALVWGLRSVGPSLIQGAAPSDGTIATLRSALKGVGGAVWSRTFSRPQIALSPDGERIFTVDNDEWALWRGADGQKTLFAKEQNSPAGEQKGAQASTRERFTVTSTSFSTGGNLLLVTKLVHSNDGSDVWGASRIFQYEIWDLRDKERLLTSGSGQTYVQFASDDSRVLVGNNEKARIIDGSSGTDIYSLEEKSDHTSLSPNGQQVIQVINGSVVFRNLSRNETRTERMAFQGGGTLSSTFSEDGTRVVIFQNKESKESLLTLWDVESGKRVGTIKIDSEATEFEMPTYAFKILPGNTAVLVTRTDVFGENPVTKIWAVANNTLANIKENIPSIIIDDRTWYFMRTDKTSRTIMVDPKDNSTWVEFKGLPEDLMLFAPSKRLNAAVTLNTDGVMEYWKPGGSSVEIDKLSPPELYRLACERLRFQDKELAQVESLCRPLLK